MPITPLHFAVAVKTDRASLCGFFAANALIDVEPIFVALSGIARPLHGTFHTLAGVICIAGLLVALCPRTWRAGIIWGAISHLILDAIVHVDVKPLWPLTHENPLHVGGSIGFVSGLCLALILLRLFLHTMNKVPRTGLKERRRRGYF